MNDKEFTLHLLSVPNDIKFLDYRNKYGKTWLTTERKILRMRDMHIGHVDACIGMLERLEQQQTLAYQGLVKELARRKNEKI